MAFLEERKQHIRGLIAAHLRLKFTPALLFFLDDTLNQVERINTLIKKIHDDAGEKSGNSGS